ncbi:MAG TPA: DUF6596 domain-containing protein [Saprospiraceae bacterium]|nr:DUF6596 domain-containing protein [Saprospiraceae bacterium]
MDQEELLPHLFRTEFSKITTVLSKLFGLKYIEIAEDIAAESFLAASETWPYKGIPENPTAWLYAVAKNKTKNYLNRDHHFKEVISIQFQNSTFEFPEIEVDLSQKNISDSQLQMLFAICHPSISVESQIALALRILCGFGIDEIANALLSNKETINKRLLRAKEKLRMESWKIEFPATTEIKLRLETVLSCLYLIFNEAYYSETDNSIIRQDLCFEAMRLNQLLLDNLTTNTPAVNALYALMCFQSSRFDARKNANGEIILYSDQDQSLWNYELISKGAYYLHQASQGDKISKYHLEAGIAYWYTIKEDTPEKWENILQLFNQLLQMEYTPIIALNRTYALSKVYGKEVAITEAEKLNLTDNQFYYSLLGELYKDTDSDKARQYFLIAHSLAKTNTEKLSLQKKIESV